MENHGHIPISSITSPIRWAGGKRWLVNRYPNLFISRSGRLIEPFAGSAAVFFATLPEEAVLSDMNEELIDVYRAIRLNPTAVMDSLRSHDAKHNKEYFYEMRASKENDIVAASSRMIYLNRTCFNALYRVNRKGQFNVPLGSKVSVMRHDDNFAEISALLQRAKLIHGDFESAIALAEPGDLIYADPPYTVKHNLNGFVKYNEKIFTFEDQIRLKRCLDVAVSRGVDVLVSNADHESIRELYDGFGLIKSIGRASLIAGLTGARGSTTESLTASPSLRVRLAEMVIG